MDEESKKALAAGAEALKNVTDIFNKLAGPLADELGQMFGDKARVYRVKNAIKTLQLTRQMLADAGLVAEPIPPRLFLPALEAASTEDNESLQKSWAALLANAASPISSRLVLPSFVEILRELTPEEAKFMARIYERAMSSDFRLADDPDLPEERPAPPDRGVQLGTYRHILDIVWVGEPVTEHRNEQFYERMKLIVDDLVRLGLLDRMPWYPPAGGGMYSRQLAPGQPVWVFPNPGESDYFLTAFGLAFMKACEAPQRGA